MNTVQTFGEVHREAGSIMHGQCAKGVHDAPQVCTPELHPALIMSLLFQQ
ncbi:MAG: hypothetical protein GXY42_08935 [Desulfovibrionales bacterium]|nr:hypothetical protein [Desulfovibrionales bacterium]